MRDLGLMGESTFSLWCGDSGLIPNGSKIDKTGWDFYVEFPHDSTTKLPVDMQGAPIECKIQVKATDKKHRRLSVKLSNLRRLITAPLPTFLMFIEFDGTDSAKDAFLVHIDKELTNKVLRRLRKIEQIEGKNDFNKRTITIKYSHKNRLNTLDGKSLKQSILKYIPSSLEDYISNKNKFLQSTGFENGFAKIQFKTAGIDNLKKLINVSIGLEDNVEVEGFSGHHVRFGITNKYPFIDCETGKVSMPEIKPNSQGVIRFRDDNLSPFLSFKISLYVSPFNPVLEESLKTIRIEGDFFDLVFRPFDSKAYYSFYFDNGLRLKLNDFRDALTLFSKLSSPGNTMHAEMEFNEYPSLQFSIMSGEASLDVRKEIQALNHAIKIAEYFGISSDVDISFNELKHHAGNIIQYINLIEYSVEKITIDFTVDGDEFDPEKKVCTLSLLQFPLGNYVVSVILLLFGYVKNIKNNKYHLIPDEMIIEKKLVTRSGKSISHKEIEHIFNEIEKKYEHSGLEVVTMKS